MCFKASSVQANTSTKQMSTFLNKIDSREFPAFLVHFKEVVCSAK